MKYTESCKCDVSERAEFEIPGDETLMCVIRKGTM